MNHSSAGSGRDLRRGILAAGVQHDNFIGEGDRSHRRFDAIRLVLGNDDS